MAIVSAKHRLLFFIILKPPLPGSAPQGSCSTGKNPWHFFYYVCLMFPRMRTLSFTRDSCVDHDVGPGFPRAHFVQSTQGTISNAHYKSALRSSFFHSPLLLLRFFPAPQKGNLLIETATTARSRGQIQLQVVSYLTPSLQQLHYFAFIYGFAVLKMNWISSRFPMPNQFIVLLSSH